jgi:photosystem II stability/assembly factor-like uncharacterized protein
MKKISLIILLACITLSGYSQLNWYPQNSGTNVVLFDIHFVDHLYGWACGNSGSVLHTIDGGSNWYDQEAPPNNTYYGIHFPGTQAGYACGYGGKIIQTSDGGLSWTTQVSNTNTYLYDIFFIDEQTGWIVGGDNGTFPSYISHQVILHTSDGGNTWIKQVEQSYESPLRCVFFINQNNGYAVSEGGDILATTNSGYTWSTQETFSSYEFRGVFFTDINHGWVVGEYLGLPHAAAVFVTENGGSTWIEHVVTEDYSFNAVFFNDNLNGWLAGGTSGEGALYYTHDGGLTWIQDDPVTENFLFDIHFVDYVSGWAVGNIGTIISSSDPVGIEDRKSSVNISVYPNPASESLTIEIITGSDDHINISMLNAVGQVVYREETFVPNSLIIKIDTRDYNNGLYFLIVDQQNERTIKKVIVNH